MARFAALVLAAAVAACASRGGPVAQVQHYLALRDAADESLLAPYAAPDARIWFERKEGAGEPYGHHSRWRHWDQFFRSQITWRDWRADGNKVSAIATETNDFYKLVEMEPSIYRMTWWLDDRGRIAEALLEPIEPAHPKPSRLREFRQWASATHPADLEYLMPDGKLDPSGDRAERWLPLLREWRATVH